MSAIPAGARRKVLGGEPAAVARDIVGEELGRGA